MRPEYIPIEHGNPTPAPISYPAVIKPYKGFESILHYYVAKHSPEIEALMSSFGFSGAASPLALAKHIRESKDFAEALTDTISLIESANGYGGDEGTNDYVGIQYEGHDGFDSWAAAKMPEYGSKSYDNANGGKMSGSDILSILGTTMQIGGGIASGIGGMLGRGKGGAQPQQAPPPPPPPSFFERYKVAIIGGVVAVVALVAVLIITKK
jgi:hypothetical protein